MFLYLGKISKMKIVPTTKTKQQNNFDGSMVWASPQTKTHLSALALVTESVRQGRRIELSCHE